MTEVQPFVHQAPVLPSKEERYRALRGSLHDLARHLPGAHVVPLSGTGACRGPHDEDGVGNGFLEGLEDLRVPHHILTAVGDSADAVLVEFVGFHQAKP